MARIRTIKPEFWTDGKTGTLSDRAKLLLIGLLNHCDDYGVIEMDEAELKAKIFPYDNRSLSEAIRGALMDELLPKGLIVMFYYGQDASSSKPYIHITNFDRHQRIDRPSPPILKGWKRGDNPETFGEREAVDSGTLSSPSSFDEDSASDQRGLSEDSAQEGKERKEGKEGKEVVAYTPPERDQDAPKPDRKRKPKPVTDQPAPPASSSNGFKRVRDILIEDPVIAPPDEDTERTRREQLKRLQEGRSNK